ncbi:hypothetical protein SKAU_G00083280 [Synaphobranchus kaupii]|uniref:Uncharacterized protein n=1 Tax=Synaphobranchus kaupii TaxID=118154 RepID=A0A9Q1FV81_SYNKA|nr:hypothetical protein SKAU_G00083280 [Synaphobranchus kaupii]
MDTFADPVPSHPTAPHTPQGHKSRAKKKSSKVSQYRRDQLTQEDLPPSPRYLRLQKSSSEKTSLTAARHRWTGKGLRSHPRRGEGSTALPTGRPRRRGTKRMKMLSHIANPGFLSRAQMSSNCSTTGSVSSHGSTGSREHGSRRKRSEEMR